MSVFRQASPERCERADPKLRCDRLAEAHDNIVRRRMAEHATERPPHDGRLAILPAGPQKRGDLIHRRRGISGGPGFQQVTCNRYSACLADCPDEKKPDLRMQDSHGIGKFGGVADGRVQNETVQQPIIQPGLMPFDDPPLTKLNSLAASPGVDKQFR